MREITHAVLRMDSKKTKIAIVANTTWNIYNFRLNVLSKLLMEGYQLYVIAPVDKYIIYKDQFPDIIHVPLKRLYRDSINPFKDLVLMMELSGIYKKIQPDMIIHYTVKPNIYGGFAARMNNIPSIGIVTGLGYAFLHNGFIKWVTKRLYQLSSSHHSKLIFENIDDRELFIRSGIIASDKGVSIKGCGVDTLHYRSLQTKVFSSKTIFTFIGRLIYDKGVKEFVEAAKLVKEQGFNAEFWMVGDIDHQNPAAVRSEDLVKWVKESIIIYHGSTDDVRSFIQDSDCVVLPSYREAIARSLTEAMSMECPVISSDAPGCKEAVDNGGNGYLVPIKNAEALADAMIAFLNLSNEEKIGMGKKGRQKALKEFDDKIIADQISGIVSNALKNKKREITKVEKK